MYLLTSFIAGVIIGNIQLAVLSKPMSFCLPGHPHVPRKLIFISGIVASILVGFSFATFPSLSFTAVCTTVTAASLLAMVVLLAGVVTGL